MRALESRLDDRISLRSLIGEIMGSMPRGSFREVEQELRVAAGTGTHVLATSIVKNFEEGKRVVLSCIGVKSQSQALKAVAVANGYVAPKGFVFVMLPSFHVTRFPDKDQGCVVEKTAVRFALIKFYVGGDCGKISES